jgi:hypothetical protein
MKTHKIILTDIKASDGWSDMIYTLKFDAFQKEHSELDEDELNDLFYEQFVAKNFQYGEYASLELVFDENLNIVKGKILPFKK